MSSVVLLRAATVGGHQRFKPADLARELRDLRIRSIGAAGTFVVHAEADEGMLHEAFRERLPFEPQLAVIPGDEVLALVASDPLAVQARELGAKRHLAFLLEPLASWPDLPVDQPAGADWQVRVAQAGSWYALCLRRGSGRGVAYPNPAVERLLGVPATTRTWGTVETVARRLREGWVG